MKNQAKEKLKKLDLNLIKNLITEECYMSKELCEFVGEEPTDNNCRCITKFLKENEIFYPYPKIPDIYSRIVKKYEDVISEWWNYEKLKLAIEHKLKNNLVINYADVEKKHIRYVISIKCHPRASSGNQVKAHIILWELHNKRPFPLDHVLVPKDKDFTNLDINNFELISNEDHRSIVASGKRNHFYTTGIKEGVCYKGGWKTISKKFLNSKGKCEVCNSEIRHELNTHHLISYHLFDKPKDAHFNDNLICLCDKCHRDVHSKKINLSGFLSEKIRLNLLELLEQLKEKYQNSDKEILVDFSIKSISSQAN